MKATRTMKRGIVLVLPSLAVGMACANAGSNDAPEPIGNDASYVGDTGLTGQDARADADVDCDGSDACASAACESADFCTVPNALTAPIAVNAISGTAGDDVWLAGSRGTLLHYDGAQLRAVDTQIPNTLIGIWAAERGVAWVVPLDSAPLRAAANTTGELEAHAVPGDVWPAPTDNVGRVRAVGGTANDVWLVGEPANSSRDWLYNQIIRRRGQAEDGGTTWAPVLTDCQRFEWCGPPLRALQVFSPSSAWAMGAGGGFRLEAALDAGADADADAGGGAPSLVWTPYSVQGQTIFEGVWGKNADDTWAVGTKGAIVHFGTDGNPRWQPEAPIVATDLHGIWGSSENDIWAVGDDGRVLHYDGSAWSLAESGLPDNRRNANLFAVWGSGPDDVWIGGDGVLLHRTAQNRRRP